MTPYKNLGGDSGIIAYEIGNDYIRIQFRSGAATLYTYTNGSAGSSAIQTMKSLALSGQGLNSYVSTNKPGYSSKC